MKATISTDELNRAKTYLSDITTDQHYGLPIREMLVDILLKYGRSLDSTNWQSAFLFFWQVLETITLQNPNKISMDTVTQRAYNLVVGRGKGNLLLKEALNGLKKTRNELVHSGNLFDEYKGYRVDMMKWVTDKVIAALFTRATEFPNIETLEAYYTYATMKDARIVSHRKALDVLSAKEPSS